MPILKTFSIIAYGLAAVLFVASFVLEELFFLPPAFTAIVAGVLFAAVEIIIKTLLEIRDALVPLPAVEVPQEPAVESPTPVAAAAKPIATTSADLRELGDKIKKMRQKR